MLEAALNCRSRSDFLGFLRVPSSNWLQFMYSFEMSICSRRRRRRIETRMTFLVAGVAAPEDDLSRELNDGCAMAPDP